MFQLIIPKVNFRSVIILYPLHWRVVNFVMRSKKCGELSKENTLTFACRISCSSCRKKKSQRKSGCTLWLGKHLLAKWIKELQIFNSKVQFSSWSFHCMLTSYQTNECDGSVHISKSINWNICNEMFSVHIVHNCVEFLIANECCINHNHSRWWLEIQF